MNAFDPIQRIYVRPPHAEAFEQWKAYGWHAEPDPRAAADEHAGFVRALIAEVPDVVVGTEPVPGDPDAVYAYDPTLVTEAGVIPLRPGKEGRRDEVAIVSAELEAVGCTILPPIEAPATAEGGDMFFLDDHTLLVGLSYRTNEAAVEQLRPTLAAQGVEVVTFDLSHFHGPGECLHLMSFISPLDVDLVVVYLPMMPVRLVHLLEARDIAMVEVPEEEFLSLGPNVLALGPRRAITVDANPITRSRMHAAGVEVLTYPGNQICLNGDGGPTCLTRPLVRA